MLWKDTRESIGDRNTCITNLQFADDMAGLAEEELDQEALVDSLNKTCTGFVETVN